MRISMVAIGSTGDVRPYVLLGKELKKRGHEVTIVCFDMTEKLVTEAGLNFAPLAGSVKDIFMAVMTPAGRSAAVPPHAGGGLQGRGGDHLHVLRLCGLFHRRKVQHPLHPDALFPDGL